MLQTKYGFTFEEDVILVSRKRLINQMWKLIPMREHNENWEKQLDSVIEEITGLHNIFSRELNFLTLLCKLEGLYQLQDFVNYRRTIFECISLLGELYHG